MSIQNRITGKPYFDGWQVQNCLGYDDRTALFRMVSQQDSTAFCALKVVNLIEEPGRWTALSEQELAAYNERRRVKQQIALRDIELMLRLRGDPALVTDFEYKLESFQDTDSFGCDLLIRTELLRSLYEVQQSSPPFPELEIIRVGEEICRSLIVLHRAGAVHLGVSPQSIFRDDREGHYRLGSLCAAHFSERRFCNAPEQQAGVRDPRTDLYSLGLTLYGLANPGRCPSPGQTNEPLPPPQGVNPALSAVILRACASRQEQRYQSAQELLDALRRAKAGKMPAGSAAEHPNQPAEPVEPVVRETAQRPAADSHSTVSPHAPAAPRPDHPKRRLAIGLLAGVLFVAIAGFLVFQFYHTWTPATCTEPETCSLCGKTRGSANGHQWEEATCTTPMTCSVCGETTGTAQHTWVEATHELPKTCSVCGETEGVPLGYISSMNGDWAEESITLHYSEGYPLILDETVTQCFRFTLHFKISDVTGNPFGTFAVYGRNDADEWIQLGTFQVEQEGEMDAQIDLTEPASFSAVYVMPQAEEDCTWKDAYYLRDIYTNNE